MSGPTLLTRGAAAVALGVTPAVLTKWTERGCPVTRTPQGKRNQVLYDVEAVRAWHAERRARTAEPQDARAQRDMWQARLARQTFQTRAARLLAAADVERALAAKLAGARAVALAWPTTLAPSLTAAASRGESAVEALLDAAVREFLAQLAGREPDASELEPEPEPDVEVAS